MFGNAGRDYLRKYGFKEDDDVFARIAHKNHKHSVNNPLVMIKIFCYEFKNNIQF